MIRLGIDLGTTFSCVAFMTEDGQVQVIPDTNGDLTTPSVIWTDGRSAFVGRVADQKKAVSPHFVFEYVKRNMGAPVEPVVEASGDVTPAVPYEIGGFRFGADGMSAIILRKLKLDALRYAKQHKLMAADLPESEFEPETIITVPAYFLDGQREATIRAGMAAGLRVIDLVNEPTAAACAYSTLDGSRARILVFDLGGGTFDVTVVSVVGGNAEVKTSKGDSALGGKDWDEIILDALWSAYRARFGEVDDDDLEFQFYLRKKAIEAKMRLSIDTAVTVDIQGPSGEATRTLYRSCDDFDPDDDNFYFEERSSRLLHRCMQLCEDVLKHSEVDSAGVGTRAMVWSDLNEIVLVGGSCRMPMVGNLLEKVSRRPVRRVVPGLNLDTVVAVGAAIRAHDPGRIQDVLTHSIGIRVVDSAGNEHIQKVVAKDTALPVERVRDFRAPTAAVLDVYEGESLMLDESTHRGRLELDNAEGTVRVTFGVTGGGSLRVSAGRVVPGTATLENEKKIQLRHGIGDSARRGEQLRTKVMNLTMRS